MGSTIGSRIRSTEFDLRELGGQSALKISGCDQMEPFLMSLVSDSDLWMYVSSLGSVTGGRVDEDHSLFPYCVEDMVHRTAGKTGPSTLMRVWRRDGSFEIWEPFVGNTAPDGVERNLYKSVLGNFIVFEEIHDRLGLTFRYRWATSDPYGFVRTSEIVNEGLESVRFDIVDGLLNMLPAGISYSMLQRMSILPDAYTECEVDAVTGVTTISLASLIVDKPEPGEALSATVVWSRGLDGASVLLSQDQIPAFRQGQPLHDESVLRGRRGSYLISRSLELSAGEGRDWDIVTDCYRSQGQVETLRSTLLSDTQTRDALRKSLEISSDNLARFVAAADGQPCTADGSADAHQQACVLFNIMRGGIYASGDKVVTSDFCNFIKVRNKGLAARYADWLESLPEAVIHSELLATAIAKNDPDLTRIAYEYLPLTFSRRHGDPSRPWNRFAIRLKNPDGSPLLAYEGNWRDIFQNWEALCLSYPMFIESIIAKFVNASTVDGYNPYRIMREGIDWEVPDPDDAWSSLGYWGDHQIIYLLKFLELAEQIRPEGLSKLLASPIFSYADVPLRLRSYDAIVRDPQKTIDFDFERNKKVEKRIPEVGFDAKLLTDGKGNVYHVTLAEKLLVPALSKLSNLVLDAGIWMNTQRPEWNDANNALVGNGVSMVTLCYLRRYLAFCKSLFERLTEPVTISSEVAEWLRGVAAILVQQHGILDSTLVTDENRRKLLDSLGQQFSSYRDKVYVSGFGANEKLHPDELAALCSKAIPYLDHSITASKRRDGLYHAYNLVDMRQPGVAPVTPLYEMLEGQVAVLSADVLKPTEVCDLIQALFDSNIYRNDQETFMLYPDRKLPGFLQKNVVPIPAVRGNQLLSQLIAAGDKRIIGKDAFDRYRFSVGIYNASVLSELLNQIEKEPEWGTLVAQYRQETLDTYEDVFGHRFFTGRSGSMYGYEGLGSIYWHMVSKLLVAVQESFFSALHSGAPSEELGRIARGYYRIRSGMGFNKTPQQFGAFPSDPYSHTPAGRGAKQPGMTGQSKEDILTRWMEFGVFSSDGKLQFEPAMLRQDEFHPEPATWHLRLVDGAAATLELPAKSLGFTVCGTPVIYQLGEKVRGTTIELSDGSLVATENLELNADLSQEIYARSGKVAKVTVSLTRQDILAD